MTRWQYLEGVRDTTLIAPETWQLAHAAIELIGVDAQVRFLDTGHFAIETHGADIGAAVLAFLDRSNID